MGAEKESLYLAPRIVTLRILHTDLQHQLHLQLHMIQVKIFVRMNQGHAQELEIEVNLYMYIYLHCTFCLSECYDDGTAYYMNNIPGKFSRHNPEHDAKRCQRQCQREPRCKFWTFDRAHEWCYLKTCRQNVKNTMAENHYISGDKNCRPPTRLSSWIQK